jgi:hypothetical protein
MATSRGASPGTSSSLRSPPTGSRGDRIGIAAVLRASTREEPHAVRVGSHPGPDRVRHLSSRRASSAQAVGRASLQHPAVGGDALRGALRGFGRTRAPGLRASCLLPSSALSRRAVEADALTPGARLAADPERHRRSRCCESDRSRTTTRRSAQTWPATPVPLRRRANVRPEARRARRTSADRYPLIANVSARCVLYRRFSGSALVELVVQAGHADII